LKTTTALAALVIALVPMGASAAKPKVKAAPTTYECAKCHMKFSAAQAKKDHYKDPMDGGKLAPVKAAKPAAKPMGDMKPASDAPMGGMKM
jgi:hypothetical protein